MGSDAIPNARVCKSNKNSSKKKRGGKQGKSKQNKVDAGREQRLALVNKEYNEEKSNDGGILPPLIPKGSEGNKTQGNQVMNARKCEDLLLINYSNEAMSWKDGSTVRSSGHNSLSKDFYGSRNSSISGSCSSSCSGADGDDGCLDDWEAVADALNAENNRQASGLEYNASKTEVSGVNGRYQGNSRAWSPHGVNCRYQENSQDMSPSGLNCRYQENSRAWSPNGVDCRYQWNSRAWSPDDVYRPRNLPSILKKQYKQNQRNSASCFSGPSCPICCEDFDTTDSSFRPCPCGFQLCLFCHHTISEVDGRCPACRKHYDSVKAGVALAVQMTQSVSKHTWL